MTTESGAPDRAVLARAAVDDDPARYRVLSVRAIVAWAVLVGAGVAVWLLLAYTAGDTDANRVHLDAIRTAGTIVVGTGGAAALLLAARRQRTAEIALKQKDRDQADVARAHALQERVATDTRADAEARRITDLYTKAAEQLGSEKAPVRLAGLYALERLAQDHVEQRQTIVNVLCAYLRMPYTLPGDPPADGTEDTLHRERTQEREVRLTAQRILTTHLRDHGRCQDHPAPTFWADIDIDLTGAHLINFDLLGCRLRAARFTSATFTGTAAFRIARFTDIAFFNLVTFTGAADFGATTFTRPAVFVSAAFSGPADFSSTTFTDSALFDSVTFTQGTPPEVTPFMSPDRDTADEPQQ